MSHLDVVLDDIGPLQPLVFRDADLLPDVLQVAQRFIQARHSLRCEHLAAGTQPFGDKRFKMALTQNFAGRVRTRHNAES